MMLPDTTCRSATLLCRPCANDTQPEPDRNYAAYFVVVSRNRRILLTYMSCLFLFFLFFFVLELQFMRINMYIYFFLM